MIAEVGYSEIFLIAIILIVVVGPKDLPKILHALGKTAAKIRHMSEVFQAQFRESIAQIENDELKKIHSDLKHVNDEAIFTQSIDKPSLEKLKEHPVEKGIETPAL
jgi:sec-independent protein translocase protein TatB